MPASRHPLDAPSPHGNSGGGIERPSEPFGPRIAQLPPKTLNGLPKRFAANGGSPGRSSTADGSPGHESPTSGAAGLGSAGGGAPGGKRGRNWSGPPVDRWSRVSCAEQVDGPMGLPQLGACVAPLIRIPGARRNMPCRSRRPRHPRSSLRGLQPRPRGSRGRNPCTCHSPQCPLRPTVRRGAEKLRDR